MPPELAQCAPQVSPVLMHALVRTESAWNPYAIGPDAGQPAIGQPRTLEEAIKTVKQLAASGGKFSVGLAQIHISNVISRGMSWDEAFDPCRNLRMGQTILFENYSKALKEGYGGIDAVWAALRGYNSGGVHKVVSDGYATKIFTYMQTRGANASAVTKKTTPASTDPRFAQFPRQAQINAVAAGGGVTNPASVPTAPTIMPAANPNTLRPGESPDIFQDREEIQGF